MTTCAKSSKQSVIGIYTVVCWLIGQLKHGIIGSLSVKW